MNTKIRLAKALYTINKEAKVYRDKSYVFREHIKDALFHGCLDFTKEEKRILKEEYDIDIDFWEGEGYQYYKQYLNSRNSLNDNILTEIYENYPEIYAFFDEYDISFTEYIEVGEVNITGLIEDSKQNGLQGIPKDIMDMIYEVQDWIEEDKGYAEKIRKYADRLHKLLKEKDKYTKIKQNLYVIKTIFLENYGENPVAFHRLPDSDGFVLEMFDIEGFLFHHPVPEEVVDKEKIEEWNVNQVSAENKLEEIDRITINEALRIILGEFGTSEMVDDVLNGEDISIKLRAKGLIQKYSDIKFAFYRDDDDFEYDYTDEYDI